jgi:hypothetical protein
VLDEHLVPGVLDKAVVEGDPPHGQREDQLQARVAAQ